jgi:hypothetical protein
MKRYAIPAALIVVTTAVLVLLNEFTNLGFVADYAYLFIMAAMLVGVFMVRASDDS